MTRHVFQCIDGHTAGMPVRMVVSGAPFLTAASAPARRSEYIEKHDWIRRALTMEPRGHAFMSGTILYPPADPANDMALVFIETSGFLPMCGHATIGSVTFAIEHGLIIPNTPGLVRIETPAGIVSAKYQKSGNKVVSVRFTNVPSFLLYRDVGIFIDGLGALTIDIAYGGNFYAIVEQQANYHGRASMSIAEHLRFGRAVQQAANAACQVVHPLFPEIHGVRHCLWSDAYDAASDCYPMLVIAGDYLVDRSPCGTGTSARVAQQAARKLLQPDATLFHQSISGGRFAGRIEEYCTVGELAAVRPSVEGQAFVTGFNTLFVDEAEPFAAGYLIE